MAQALHVFAVFLGLGCRAFGGPVAHLGYFHALFVTRRGWLDEARYAELVALCHALPGPSSSQVATGIGHARAGLPGAVAALVGFALPSAVAMTLLGLGAAAGARLFRGAAWHGMLHGLALVALVVVAQALVAMARTLAPDAKRRAIALVAALAVALVPGEAGQLGAMAVGAALGLGLLRPSAEPPSAGPAFAPRPGAVLVPLFLFALLALFAWYGDGLFGAFFRAGALVFGGGHVVLPLLQSALVPEGRVADDVFLAAYGAAQAMPGPLFTVAACLGAAARAGPHGVAGAAIALLGIFLPGTLLLLAALPFARRVATRPAWRGALAGVGAAVVGLLAAALAGPIGHAAIRNVADAVAAVLGLVLAMRFRASPLALVAAFAVFGVLVGR